MDWQEVKRIFEQALQLPIDERLGFVQRESGPSEGTFKEVLSLLRADGEAGGFLSQPALDPASAQERTTRLHSVQYDGEPTVGGTIGPYRIVDFVGAGGMGAVYRGLHQQTGRVVALKMLHCSLTDPRLAERLINEAQILSSLSHPGLATLYELFDYGGRPFLVMEYVDGLTVAQQIEANGPLHPDQGLNLIKRLADAVGYLHRCGILHRDIKAENVKITSSGGVKLIDFGLARNQAGARMTVEGAVMGTLPYMSPELLMLKKHDARSDVWALGILLFEVITGRVPFDAQTVDELHRQQTRSRWKRAETIRTRVSREADAIVARCLDLRPEKRFQDGNELVGAVRRLASGPSAASDRFHSFPQTDHDGEAASRWPRFFMMAALAALGVALWMLLRPSEGVPPATENETKTSEIAKPPSQPQPQPRQPPFDCFRRKPGQKPDQVIVTLNSLEGWASLQVFYKGVRIGSTPCYLQRPRGSRLDLVLRSPSGLERSEVIDFPIDQTYVVPMQ